MRFALYVLFASISLFVLATVSASYAHEAPSGWTYPFQCCANYDCRQTKASEVTESPDGYHVPSGEVVPMTDKRVKESPDGEFHWCAHQYGDHKTICLFVPPRSY